MKTRSLKIIVCWCVLLMAITFSACTFVFDTSGLVPEIYIETDYKISYNDEYYEITMLPGEHYLLNCDLGDYDGEEYYLELKKQDETDVIEFNEMEIVISDAVSEELQIIIYLALKKQGEEKIVSKEEIWVNIVLEQNEG